MTKDALMEYVERVYFDGLLLGGVVGFACGLALAIGVYGGLKSRC